jgi:hypothetical protein
VITTCLPEGSMGKTLPRPERQEAGNRRSRRRAPIHSGGARNAPGAYHQRSDRDPIREDP